MPAFGATAIGWNGVQLAEVARHAPAGQAGTVTGASGFVTFAGVVIGPPTFALLAAVTGSYRVGFVAFGSLSLAAAFGCCPNTASEHLLTAWAAEPWDDPSSNGFGNDFH